MGRVCRRARASTPDGLTFDFYAGFLSDRLRADTAGFLKEVEKEVNDLARAGVLDRHGSLVALPW